MPNQPPTVDLTNDIDFTALGNISGSVLNQSFSLLTGAINTPDTEGVSLSLYTTDSALDTPNVPNPFVGIDTDKWRNYIWFRRPYTTDTTGPAKIYTWNDNAISDGTFLKWIDTGFDSTSLQNQITTNTLDIASATDVANNANTTATGASTSAAAAVATANAASAGIANALALANTADLAATTALAGANAATTVANGANAAAQNALTQVANSGNITNLQPGTAGQRIRTNYNIPAANEYYSDKDNIVLVSAAGGGAAPAGVNQLALDTTVADSGVNIVSLAANDICLKAGVYEFDISSSIGPIIAGAHSMIISVYDVTAAVNVTTQLNELIGSSGLAAILCCTKGYFISDGIKKFRVNATITGIGSWGFGATLGYFKRIG